MGSAPTKAADNMYCKCRLAAAKCNDRLNSREGAAELLGISSSTLASYELGLTKVVPVESIALMADIYNAPELKNWYCKNVCPLGEDMPSVELADLDRLALKTIAILKNVSAVENDLAAITADGVISPDERPVLDNILQTLQRVAEITQSLTVWAKKNIEE